MDVWSDVIEIGKMIVAVDWWLMAVVGTALVIGAIGVWSWLTDWPPRTRRSAQRRPGRAAPPVDYVPNEHTQHAHGDAISGDTSRSAA